MSKKMMFLIMVLLLAGFIFPARVGVLTEVMKPDTIAISEGKLYVVEGSTVYIYSLKDIRFIKKFGKQGDGPGEMAAFNGLPNKIDISPGGILIDSPTKLAYFSLDGAYIKEKRKISPVILGYVSLGDNFVVRKLVQETDKKTYSCICIVDPDFKEIKELYRHLWMQQGNPPAATAIDMVMDFAIFQVYENKIFVDESDNGFHIEVFDDKGNKLYKIEKDYEKIKVTAKDRNDAENRFREDPFIKAQEARLGGWNQLKTLFSMNFPDTFPPIRDMEVSEGKIYVQTFKKTDGKDEYLVMDLKGNIIKKVFVPAFENTPMLARMMGAKLHVIEAGKLYYLIENIDEEEWELHIETIK